MVLIIGLTGPPGSGKGAVAEILAELGHRHSITVEYRSLSDEIRKEAKRREIEVDRDNLKRIANQLRRRMGSDIWALVLVSEIKEFIQKIDEDKKVLFLIDGIRNPAEVHAFRKMFGSQFRLLGVTAPTKIVYKNLLHRNREDESSRVLTDEQEFLKLIRTEMGSGEPSFGHDVESCLEMSDRPLILNDSSLEDLRKKVQAFASKHILPVFEIADTLETP